MLINKRIKSVVCLSLIITSLYTYDVKGQAKDKPESGLGYQVTRNYPEDVPAINLDISILAGNISVAGPGTLGGGVGGSFRITNNISAIGSILMQYPFTAFKPDIADGKSVNLNLWHHAEVGGIYFISNKTINGDYNVLIGNAPNSVNSPGYLKVKGDYLRKFGIRAGYYNDNNIVSGTNTTFVGYNVDDPYLTRYNLKGKFSLNMQSSVIFGGVDLETVRDIAIKYAKEDFEESRNVDFYVDLLFAPSIKYDNIILAQPIDSAFPGVYNLDKYSPKNNAGFRLGIQYAPFNNFGTPLLSWRVCYKLEAGMMPGPQKNQFFVTGGIGASFGL